ncbi:hypothetical protein [Mycolicibacterium mageritense]|uniref:hypothetical protein n=1 Tax=Mycolicibacterium mageritense TaxID=53462 RepID=UPI001E34D7C5|nr:hypothetical protein [Mycolicibacterium mageritense]MCC9186364.1 hypothetical protein [Mycolicibacterium mageritense]
MSGQPRRLSRQQVEALTAVAAGRVQYGAEYPRMARRHGTAVCPVFLIDGHGVYGGQHATFSRLSELGFIVERVDLLPTKTVPAQTKTYGTVSGSMTRDLPEHQAPADDGWQAAVELTAAGRAALEFAAQTETL